MTTVKIILIFILVMAIFLVRKNYKNQEDAIVKEKEKYNNYIVVLNSIYSKDKQQKVNPELLKQELNNLLNHMENRGIVIVDEIYETSSSRTSLIFRIKKEYFLNFLEYLYDNTGSYNVDSFSLISTSNEYIKLSMVIDYLYSLPFSEWSQYFFDSRGLKYRFWQEELKNYEQKRKIREQRQRTEKEMEKTSPYLAGKDKDEQNILESAKISEFNLDIKYKGYIMISSKRFGIIEYNNNEIFCEEGKNYDIEGFAVKILEINEKYIAIGVDGKVYFYKVEML
ncbi:MAG: hypothetical protein RMJ51_01345 [Candidatus Calescibacterium sp.]|nr:hypothetical protein [Candidatus Calescibacterium sp.]MCX7972186.1 hypothetical protein [bacterium]MDW8194876.1 hypothetical protein [Candidatus Calescibacterium sp.]